MKEVKLVNQLALEKCPHCGVNTPTLSVNNYFETNGVVSRQKRVWGVYACTGCGGAVVASAAQLDDTIIEAFPSDVEISHDIPEPARKYLKQAIDTKHAPDGSVMLSASAVDAMLKKKGYVDGVLNSRINQAARDHVLTEDMAKWAHNIRLDANDQRHADVTNAGTTGDDAQRCVDFASALTEILFVLPAKVQRGLHAPNTETRKDD